MAFLIQLGQGVGEASSGCCSCARQQGQPASLCLILPQGLVAGGG